MSLASWIQNAPVSEAEVRAEIWCLGTESHGWPLKSALEELETPDLPARRARLLRACVRKLRSR